ncbi:MAG: DUF2085 domain-containing protein [Methanoregulaceae archaeon]|nr:MAG: DUF2085 domain-containing protein [Methanoregulaceae archaeon]
MGRSGLCRVKGVWVAGVGFCFCHRRKDRSIWFFGREKVLCSRCLGILLGGTAGLLCVMPRTNRSGLVPAAAPAHGH